MTTTTTRTRRTKRVNQVSNRASARAARWLYERAKEEFKKQYPVCYRCRRDGEIEIHHTRGRAGTLLVDRRFFIPLCECCHTWVHEHPKQAWATGLLCGTGHWNSPPQDEESARLRDLIAEKSRGIHENRLKRRRARASKL